MLKRKVLAALALATSAIMGGTILGGSPVEAQETIKIGFIGPLTGGNALQGLGARNGFRLAIQQANEAGYPYEVEDVALDDASDPSVGVSAAQRLVNDPDVVAAIGHWNSPVALATIHIFNDHEIPFIVWGAISPRITEPNYLYVTRTTPTLTQENEPLVEWLMEDMGMSRFSIITDTSDYGRDNAATFTAFVEERGGEILSTDAAPVGTTDFRSIVTRVRGLEPDAVYFGGVIAEAGIVRRQMTEVGLDVPMAAISGIYDELFFEIAESAADGTLVSVPVVNENPKLQAMYDAYDAAGFEDPPGPYAKYAYDSTNIILEVIREHGIEDKEALARAIRDIEYDGVLGVTRFNEEGQTEVEILVERQVAQDGEWVTWSPN